MATRAVTRRSKPNKQRVPEDVKIARLILPEGQARPGRFVAVDISNHSEADQRKMVRSGERRTIRRLSHMQRLAAAKTITLEQAIICEWYARQHELGYQTVGCTANYSGAGGGGFGSSDLLARYRAQAQARLNYLDARKAIPEPLLPLFERIVLHGHGLAGHGEKPSSYRYSRLSHSFRLACDRLREVYDHLAGEDC